MIIKTMKRMAELPILYSFRRCPYAMRARMAMHISEVQYEHREILLRDKPPEMLKASSKGTVPVVVLPDGRVIDESLDVMQWALAQNDPEGWLAGVDEALIAANDWAFKAALDRYKYPHRYDLDDATIPRDSTLDHLESLNERLSSHAYLTGERRGFTDIALFPFLRQFAETDRTWFNKLSFIKLQQWLDDLISSELFNVIMIKHPLWKQD
jgi:glutathione S-transferase